MQVCVWFIFTFIHFVGSEIIYFIKLTPHEAKTQELTDAMK